MEDVEQITAFFADVFVGGHVGELEMIGKQRGKSPLFGG